MDGHSLLVCHGASSSLSLQCFPLVFTLTHMKINRADDKNGKNQVSNGQADGRKMLVLTFANNEKMINGVERQTTTLGFETDRIGGRKTLKLQTSD